MSIAVDNDILHKGSGYGLLQEMINLIPAQVHEVNVLRTAKFVVTDKLRKANLADALSKFQQFIQRVQCVEPTASEAILAAELEYEAQCASLSFDTGESLLCAIAIKRSFSFLVTGDKRAINSLERLILASLRNEIIKLAGKVICLEQLMFRMVNNSDARSIQRAICAQPRLDKTLSICFSCTSPEVGPESWLQCLTSYISELRSSASTILAH